MLACSLAPVRGSTTSLPPPRSSARIASFGLDKIRAAALPLGYYVHISHYYVVHLHLKHALQDADMTAVRLYGLRLSSQCRVIPVPERITLERSESTCNAGLVEARLSPSSVSVSLGARPSGSLSLSLSLSLHCVSSASRPARALSRYAPRSLRAEIVTRRDRYAPRSLRAEIA